MEAGADGDYSVRARYFQLEVGGVGYSHELRETRPPEQGMVGAREIDHLEGEWLLAEVLIFIL